MAFTYRVTKGSTLSWAEIDNNLSEIEVKWNETSNNAAIASASANFKGNWTAQSGAGAVPTSVFHNSKYWLLLSPVADILANEPGVSAVWAEIATGFAPGSGGLVTQLTSKSTAVTLNKSNGRITMHNAALAAGASVLFEVTNSFCTTAEVVTLTPFFGAVSPANYRVELAYTATGKFGVRVTNISGGSLSEALQINFAVTRIAPT